MESRECRAGCHEKSIAISEDGKSRGCRRCESADPKTLGPTRHSPICSHCRGKSEEKEIHEYNDKTVGIPPATCRDKFALARRLHAENLQHQPLPDKVDDRVFRDASIAHRHRACSASCAAKGRDRGPKGRRFGPPLGCKDPKTRMDLAICWETPLDPVYEPRLTTHVDGSNGGTAPSIFALIQHRPAPKSRELLTRAQTAGEGDDDEGGRSAPEASARTRDRCCCECLCDDMRSIAVAEKPRASSLPRITERRCAACEPAATKKEDEDPRLIKSSVGFALGLEKRGDDARRNGLPPAKAAVPRPRTPFARRSFCIDTLTPPFSVVNGCRDADYPEHWRLMSVYQQSYRNPQRRRTGHF